MFLRIPKSTAKVGLLAYKTSGFLSVFCPGGHSMDVWVMEWVQGLPTHWRRQNSSFSLTLFDLVVWPWFISLRIHWITYLTNILETVLIGKRMFEAKNHNRTWLLLKHKTRLLFANHIVLFKRRRVQMKTPCSRRVVKLYNLKKSQDSEN